MTEASLHSLMASHNLYRTFMQTTLTGHYYEYAHSIRRYEYAHWLQRQPIGEINKLTLTPQQLHDIDFDGYQEYREDQELRVKN